MPSLTSAFSLGRGGKSERASSVSAQPPSSVGPRLAKTRSTSLFAKAPKTPLETSSAVRSRPTLTPGSSCSSDGSTNLQTPEDDTVMPLSVKPDDKKRWSSWFGWRKPSEKDDLGSPVESDPSAPRALPTNKAQGEERAASKRVSNQNTSDSDNEDQSFSESSESPETSTVIAPSPVPPRASVSQARANLRTLLRNSLSRLPSPPPLVETTSTLFPHSCAALGGAPQALSLESSIHVRRMLWRLDHRTLSDSEARSILGLARRPQPKETSRNRMERRTDDDIIAYASMRVGRYSRGLRKWASRPCFEQRFLVWMPDEKGRVSCKGVMGVGRDLAVCELEFSEGLEALAGLELDDHTFEQSLSAPSPPPKKLSKPKHLRQASPPDVLRKSSFRRTQAQLCLDRASPAEPVLTTVSPLSPASPGASSSASPLDANYRETPREALRGTSQGNSRYAHAGRDDSEADESIPLGYAMQAKKRREEKARFLLVEQEKRAKEMAQREAMEKQRHEIEERRALEEQRRREQERKRIEEEKKMLEEKMKEKYDEEIAASRQRRESARLGMDNYTNIREMHQRESEDKRTYARPAYDPTPARLPRRSASDFANTGGGLAKTISNKSRPASMTESSQGKRRSAYNPDYPPSEDVRSASHYRQQNGPDISQRPHHASRPPSITSSSSRPVSVHRAQSAPNQVPFVTYPMMPMMPQMPAFSPVPPVPPMPVWNMPLLPPNAPFMMQQYSRSSSPGSGPRSRDHSPSSPSRRQSSMPPPSPSRRQSNLNPSTSSPSRPSHAIPSPSRHPPFASGDESIPQLPTERRGSYGASQRPSRSSTYSPLQQSLSQPIHRDDRSQKSRHGSTTNLAHTDPKRRTTIM